MSERFTGQITLTPDGAVDPQSLNTQLLLLWNTINTILGKSGTSEVQDDLSVDGNATITGEVGIGTDEPQATLHVVTETTEPPAVYKSPVGAIIGQIPTLTLEASNTAVTNTNHMPGPSIAFVRTYADGRAATSLGYILVDESGIQFYGNVNVFNGDVTSIPIAGKWTKTVVTAGQGAYDWDTETISHQHLTRQASNTQILFDQAGKYLVIFHTQADGAGSGVVTFALNGGSAFITHILPGTGIGSDVASIVNVAANDYLEVDLASAGDRFGDASFTTQLNIYRLV